MMRFILLLGIMALVYAATVYRVYRLFPAARTRLQGATTHVTSVTCVDGCERVFLDAGSVLVPVLPAERHVMAERPDGDVVRSGLTLKNGTRVATVQLSRRPRHSRLRRCGPIRSVVDGFAVLERALTSRFAYPSVLLRAMLLKDQTNVLLGRFELGALRGFAREGDVRMAGDRHGRAWQFDLFDATEHYRIDVVSCGGCLTAEQAALIVRSYRPPSSVA